MQIFANAPRTLVILLSITNALLWLQALVFALSFIALLLPLLVSALSLSALFGGRWQMTTLKYLFYVFGAFSIINIGFSINPASISFVAKALIVASSMLASAIYIGRSAQVKSFLAASQKSNAVGN